LITIKLFKFYFKTNTYTYYSQEAYQGFKHIVCTCTAAVYYQAWL